MNKSNRFGVWEDGCFIGAIIFGLGASPSLGKPYGLGVFEICELTRIALRNHGRPITQMVKLAIARLRLRNPGLRLVVSFADPFHNHHGGIYQAGNWIYTGQTSPAVILKLPNGEYADPRRFNGHGHNKKKAVPEGSEEIKTPGKHRYLYPLDQSIRRQVLPLAKPYPKREELTSGFGVNGDIAGDQLEEAGSIPASRS